MSDNKKYNVCYIYKISYPQKNIWYVGSTNKLFRRLKEHIYRFHNIHDKEYNKKIYMQLRDNNINIIDTSYEIIDILFDVNKQEVNKKEFEYINNDKKLNLNNSNVLC